MPAIRIGFLSFARRKHATALAITPTVPMIIRTTNVHPFLFAVILPNIVTYFNIFCIFLLAVACRPINSKRCFLLPIVKTYSQV
jgi:hypothetical protein